MPESHNCAPCSRNEIVLGWRVARDLKLEHWDHGKSRRLGEQPDHVLECVPPDAIAMHTAIVAQSGSGKSFFLGRYIEEVLLRTQARVTIFDPNADFRQISQPNGEIWPSPNSNGELPESCRTTGTGRHPLTHEATERDFTRAWSVISTTVTGNSLGPETDPIKAAQFHWTSLNASLLLVGEKVIPDSLGFAALHEYVCAWEELLSLLSPSALARSDDNAVVTECVSAAKRKKDGKSDDQVAKDLIEGMEKAALAGSGGKPPMVSDQDRTVKEARFTTAFRNVAAVDETVREHYLRRHLTLARRNRLAMSASTMSAALGLDDSCDIRVVDLPSFSDPDDRDTVVLFMLDAIWRRARFAWERATRDSEANKRRTPHLIVLDEAHNLVPSEKPDSPLKAEIRERIKTIAGEGRKYGLFLVLVTQRPDKIDPQVLSEAGNQAIMLMRSLAVLDSCRELMGVELSDEDRAAIARLFDAGYVRLSGKWSPTPRIVFAGARRTMTGGANLDKSWMGQRERVKAALAQSQPAGSAGQSDPLKAAVAHETLSEGSRPSGTLVVRPGLQENIAPPRTSTTNDAN